MLPILRELNRYDEAIEYLNHALLIAHEIGDMRGRGIWLGNLGLVYDDLRQPDKAVELHREAVEIARTLQDRRGLAARLGNVGNSYVSLGDYAAAADNFKEAVEIFQALGEKRELALRMGIIGNLHSEMGRAAASTDEASAHFITALDYYNQTLALARELGDRDSEAQLLRSIGNTLGNSGQYDEAIQHFRASHKLFQALGQIDPLAELQSNIELATAYRDQINAPPMN